MKKYKKNIKDIDNKKQTTTIPSYLDKKDLDNIYIYVYICMYVCMYVYKLGREKE
jgi:hypothetical protein